MTKRETDTSASEEASSDRVTRPDAEALFDALVEESVLAVGESGVRTTEEFDDTHAVYHDSYVGVDETEFHEAVAATFGLPDRHAAADLVAARDVSRAEFVTYLAVESHVDGDAPAEDLAAMAEMVSEVVPDSPVPAELADVTDDPAALLEGEERAFVSVWKRFCDPCEATKADLDTILDAVPDDAALAGVDGEVAVGFCETHAVESAPGFVLADGDDRRTICESDAEAVIDALRAFYRG
jgi:hypothetical protein